MAEPIPIVCRDNAGTGFLVADNARVWLVTCVHLVSGLKETPAIASFFTTAEIRIVGKPGAIPLFADGGQRFSVVTNQATGHLVDAIAIGLTSREIAGLISYGMYDKGSIARAEIGEPVTARGFARIGERLASGAKIEPSAVSYHVEEIAGLSLRLSAPGVGGLSGGPMSGENGLVGIMHGDVGESTAMKSALAISLDVVAGELLR